MKNKVFNLLQFIFTAVGAGLICAGYFAVPGALTDDGFPLNKFFYILGGFFIVWPLVLFNTIKFFQRRAAAKIEYLKSNGIKARAKVTGMDRTNVYINRVPQVILHLDVKTSLGEHFSADYRKCIETIYLNLIRPDTELPVYVHPEDRKKLYVDFQQAWAETAK